MSTSFLFSLCEKVTDNNNYSMDVSHSVFNSAYYTRSGFSINFPQYHHVVGKTFSFAPDEANVDDLAKACALLIIYSVY